MIRFASVVGDLLPFNVGNINDTFKALVQPSGGVDLITGIVKDLSSRELFNELFSFVVLRDLGLPVPNAFLGQVTSTETRISKAPLLSNGNKLVFVSEDVGAPSLRMSGKLSDVSTDPEIRFCLEHFVPKIAKWKKLGELYAFDAWLANVDRNLGNILLGGIQSNGEPNIWLIDHGKSFTSDNWKSGDLKPDAKYSNKLEGWATPYLTADNKKICLASAAEFEAKAKKFDKETNINYFAQAFGLDQKERDAANNFLGVRLAKLTQSSREALDMGGII